MSNAQTLKITWETTVVEKHEATVEVDTLPSAVRAFIAAGGDPAALADHSGSRAAESPASYWDAYEALGDALGDEEGSPLSSAVTERTATGIKVIAGAKVGNK